MPTYDYRCSKCGHRFELFHSITDDAPKRCPKCKSKSVRVPAGGAGLLFKGSGFYITDYRSKSYKEKAKQDKTSSGATGDSGKSGGDSGKSGGASGKSGGASGTSGAKTGSSSKSGTSGSSGSSSGGGGA